MKNLLLQNLYTGGHRVKKVENDFPVRVGEVISFDGDITDKDYKLYKVKKIGRVSDENNKKKRISQTFKNKITPGNR